jgi:glc operon protein GlcG
METRTLDTRVRQRLHSRAHNKEALSRPENKKEVMMSRYCLKLLLFLTAFLCAINSPAQTPKAYGPPISLESARKVAAAALAEAQKNGWYMAISVVDPSGTLVYYEKMDNTQTGSASVAIDKARTAALFKRPSKAFQDIVAGGGPGLRLLGLPGAVPIEGGIPLMANDQIVGAIGVSGDSSDHDGICAQAGANSLK